MLLHLLVIGDITQFGKIDDFSKRQDPGDMLTPKYSKITLLVDNNLENSLSPYSIEKISFQFL